MARLSGKKIKLPSTGAKLDRVFTYTLESMDAACAIYRKSWTFRNRADKAQCLATVPPLMMAGDAAMLPGILSGADALAEGAVVLDARLGARPGWVRGVEGVDLDAGLLAAGEEACCLDRRRMRQSERPPAGAAVRIVISTDTKVIAPAAASAFVAAARLASQFVPLEIWWQGSWLKEEGLDRGNGHVFHVPLLRAGEMDFARLQFVLCSEFRDHASYCVMFAHAFPAGLGWGAGQMEYSSLPNTHDFIPASGLQANAQSVAERAAKWAGFPPLWSAEYEANRSAAQQWAAPVQSAASTSEPTAADRVRWAKQDADARAAKITAAKARAGELF